LLVSRTREPLVVRVPPTAISCKPPDAGAVEIAP
jgi:hypothetical protein